MKSQIKDRYQGDIKLIPLDQLEGFGIRPGFYKINGATSVGVGVNFTIHSNQATACELLLYKNHALEPYAILKFPDHYRIGNVYSMIVFGLKIDEFQYAYRLDGEYNKEKGLLFNKENILLDPYAKAVVGQKKWGERIGKKGQYKAHVVENDFDWGNCKQPLTPMEDLVIYEMHVRGFTKDISSGVLYPGTFAGIMEKIPYLKELGITAVELMPIFEFDEMGDNRQYEGKELVDYWGYNTVSFFAPNASYCSSTEYNYEGSELKTLVRTLNENGIEVFLDVVFNHTAEGNEMGPCFSFKGIDNNIYYMLTPEGFYYNFSGCGNTLNCNHPIVQQMILDCLRYWVTAYRIDGFRFDLATILGRNEDGSPMEKPPLIQSLAFDPILGNVKLIAEAWDAGGLYQVGSFPSWKRWVEWNGRYRDDMRKFLKGDAGMAAVAASRITGSKDLYDPERRGNFASVNFLTCHDGFTLYDLYSYNQKHNEANGWQSTDGSNDNYSWNCGVEGETEDQEVKRLRLRMIKNACAVLMCSRGIPMFLAGDEFGNTQFGNNNAYCQDNIISWLDWNLLTKNKEIFDFFKYMIGFRHKHRNLRINTTECSMDYSAISQHGLTPFHGNFDMNHHYVGVMYAGRREEDETVDEVIYIGIHTYWEPQTVKLPVLATGMKWKVLVNTSVEDSIIEDEQLVDHTFVAMPRSVFILEGVVVEK
ncbi:MAG: glycogen debranching protein GlgX [Eubacteriales bacterium]